jgi:hypothetical protein
MAMASSQTVTYSFHYRKVDKCGYHSIVVNATHNTPKH